MKTIDRVAAVASDNLTVEGNDFMTHTTVRLRSLIGGVALVLASVAAPAHAQDKKPNVVFILVDNFGWGDFSVYGGNVPTPRIDSIANEGVRFDNYTVEAQCTPTRGAIMTGRLPVRTGTTVVP
ncbi:MAG TPA: sulfatase-like hydrolase/transferase, partial [Candidatus Angelobacter sp.]|nr:sulfatase-like hydrolase/transferase [Candidatus Angelobacter sp.]